ncbi:uncharacterized protein LOC142813883 [Rhipicephalus microplus]|uniref:uncharacterized protein LOC142813883 n=1 Tax=Rhipicephalus microplus TaxID=6941 RepID=UPI003F6BEF8A
MSHGGGLIIIKIIQFLVSLPHSGCESHEKGNKNKKSMNRLTSPAPWPQNEKEVVSARMVAAPNASTTKLLPRPPEAANRVTRAAAALSAIWTAANTPTDREAQPRWALLYLCIAAVVFLAVGFYMIVSMQTPNTLGVHPNDTYSDGTTTLFSARRSGRRNQRPSPYRHENDTDNTTDFDLFLLRTERE